MDVVTAAKECFQPAKMNHEWDPCLTLEQICLPTCALLQHPIGCACTSAMSDAHNHETCSTLNNVHVALKLARVPIEHDDLLAMCAGRASTPSCRPTIAPPCTYCCWPLPSQQTAIPCQILGSTGPHQGRTDMRVTGG